MLTALRYGAGSTILKYLVFGTIFAAMAGMAVMDIGGFFRSGGVGRNNVAVIGHNAIGINEFYRQYQNTLRQANIDPKTAAAAQLPYAVLNQEITRRLFLDAAARSNIRVGETYIADLLAKQLDSMGVTTDKRTEFFKDYLRRTGMTEAGLVSNMRQETAAALMSDSLQQKIIPADLLIKQIYIFEKEQRNAHIVKVSFNGIGNVPNFSDKEIKEFYDTNPSLSAIPETRNLSYVVLSKQEFLKDRNISDKEIENYYKENAANFSTPETRVFEQIIAKTQEDAEKIAAEVKDGKTDLKSAADKIIGAGKFDFVSAQPYARDGLPAEVISAVFPDGEKSAPYATAAIKTGYGFHVIRVTAINKPEQKPLTDALKKEIVTYLKDTQAEEAVYKTSEKIEDMAASGSTISEIAKELSLPVKTIKGVTAQGTDINGKSLVADIKDAKAIIDNGFMIAENEVSPIIEAGDVTLIAVGADKVTASSRKPVDDVKGEIKSAMTERFKSTAAREKADEILKKATEGKKTLQALADEYNLPFEQTRFVGRVGDEKADSLSQDARNVLFRLNKALNPVQSIQTKEGIEIIALGSVKSPTSVPTKGEEIDSIRNGFGQMLSGEIMDQFTSYRKIKTGVKINDALIQQYFFKSEEEEQ